ncbi:MAG: hypothetical protein GY832_04740, partial [Chloroflexi bacterium]|nr:hypothetical protein [Chloroflexota bacterium]
AGTFNENFLAVFEAKAGAYRQEYLQPAAPPPYLPQSFFTNYYDYNDNDGGNKANEDVGDNNNNNEDSDWEQPDSPPPYTRWSQHAGIDQAGCSFSPPPPYIRRSNQPTADIITID